MTQHPAKLAWKEKYPFGLSASQFGMALGFHGKVSDYVKYRRDIVGTKQEFKGNDATAHGIRTEPKARALYELLTGIQVFDGGFAFSDERLLGCSPDGRSFYYVEPEKGDSHSSHSPPRETEENDVTASSHSASPDRRSFSESDAAAVPRSRSDVGSGGGAAATAAAAAAAAQTQASVWLLGSPSGSSLEEISRSPSLSKMTTTCSVKIPFRAKYTRSSIALQPTVASVSNPSPTALLPPQPKQQCGSAPPSRSPPQYPRRRLRLLEIKSPVGSLYHCGSDYSKPFGIPLSYMCQIQGQMAIAQSDECDFFVFLNGPPCQVEAWRVHRCPAFWDWAHPKLLQVVSWIRDGLPSHIDRSFSFEPFDFASVTVVPLIHPFCLSTQSPLTDATRFAFFNRFASPYLEGPAKRSPQSGVPLCGAEARLEGVMEAKSVTAIRSDIARFLFDESATSAEEAEEEAYAVTHCTSSTAAMHEAANSEDTAPPKSHPEATGAPPNRLPRRAVFCAAAGVDAAFFEEAMRAVVFRNTWGQPPPMGGHGPATKGADGFAPKWAVQAHPRLAAAEVQVTMPEDWESGELEVSLRLPGENVFTMPHRVPFFSRDYLTLLTRCLGGAASTMGEATGAGKALAERQVLTARVLCE